MRASLHNVYGHYDSILSCVFYAQTSVTLCPPSDTEPPPMKDEQWMNST